MRSITRGGCVAAVLALCASPAGAFSFADGRVEIHGFFQTTVRTLSDGYRSDLWYTSQWANVLNLESDLMIAPDGWGPFDLISGFARVEVRYECVYTGCGTQTYRRFGDRSKKGPARNWTDGHTSGLTGLAPNPDGQVDIHGSGTRLLGLLDNPLLDACAISVARTWRPPSPPCRTMRSSSRRPSDRSPAAMPSWGRGVRSPPCVRTPASAPS